MPFNVNAARQSGYSDQEIQQYLSSTGRSIETEKPQQPGFLQKLVRGAGERIGAPKIGQRVGEQLQKPVPEFLQPFTRGVTKTAETIQQAPAFRETAGAFARGFIPTANIGIAGTPPALARPETPVGKVTQVAGAVTGALAPQTVGAKVFGAAGRIAKPVTKPVGKAVKGGLKKLGEKFMNIFIKSEHGKDVLKYVPNIFKAKNLDEAGNIIGKAKIKLGKQLGVEAGIVKPPKAKTLASLNKLKKRYTGRKTPLNQIDEVINMVKKWKPQKFQTAQQKKQVAAEIGSSAYGVGKSAKARAERAVADVLRPFLEKTAAAKGTDIREINRAYNALREAEKAVIKAAKTHAKSKPINWLDIAPLALGPKGIPLIGARQLLKAPKTYQKGAQFITGLTKKGIGQVGKKTLSTLGKLGITGLSNQ